MGFFCFAFQQRMSHEEREPYQKMAQQHREFLRENGERYTSQGVPLSVVEAEQKAKEQKADTIKNTIAGMLDAGVASNGKDFRFR